MYPDVTFHISATVQVNGNGGVPEEEMEQEGWEQVGPKNKSVITREAKFEHSPISAMMRGQLRSVLHKTGARETATLEPFFTLQLDISGKDIRCVEDALNGLTTRETLHGFTCSKTKQEVSLAILFVLILSYRHGFP
jgi:ubiquitin carboxyl-terminal hydrolase 10